MLEGLTGCREALWVSVFAEHTYISFYMARIVCPSVAAPCRAIRPGRSQPLSSALPTSSQGREQELESRQQEAEAADKERKAAAQRHQRDLAQEAARLQGIADQQQVFPRHQSVSSCSVEHVRMK
jgi:hypothetical protein